MSDEDLEKLGDIVDDSTVVVTYEPIDAQKLEALVRYVGDKSWLDYNAALAELKSTPDWALTKLWSMIFLDHSFARALFGERPMDKINGKKFVAKKLPQGVVQTAFVCPAFEYHLQQAIILPTPSEQIDYFYRAVFRGKPAYPADDPHFGEAGSGH